MQVRWSKKLVVVQWVDSKRETGMMITYLILAEVAMMSKFYDGLYLGM